MAPSSDFRIAGRLGLVTTLAMFGLIVVGSVVRTTGSGLACPDWPLCNGRLLPTQSLHVFLEWLHRLLALLVSVLLFATGGWIAARRALRARLGGLAALAIVLLLTQVLLGALTVWKLLHPAVVSSHLATALLLFATVTALTQLAFAEADGPEDLPAGPPGLRPLLVGATVLLFAQAVLGGIVSTSHAGLACPDWPACRGRWFPPLADGMALHMLHRTTGYVTALVMVMVAVRARRAPDPAIRAGTAMTLSLTLAQVVLGVTSVLLGTPVWLVAMHLATAAALLALLTTLTLRAARLPATQPAPALAPAR